MAVSIEEKYGIIRERDERFAFDLAKLVMDKPKASAWIIVLPFLFIFYAHWLQRYKKGLGTFTGHYLKNKVLALDAAREQSRGGRMLLESWASHATSPFTEHSGTIARLEQRELDLLRGHYHLLLNSSGSSYPDLLLRAYPTCGEYRLFMNKVIRVEEEINRAVLQLHHPTEEAKEVVQRMERFSDRLREAELAEIFG